MSHIAMKVLQKEGSRDLTGLLSLPRVDENRFQVSGEVQVFDQSGFRVLVS